MKKLLPSLFCLLLLVSACEKEINLELPPAPQEIVVEAYINQRSPFNNYVILSRTVDYFNPQLALPSVSDAQVVITEGAVNGKDTLWNPTGVQLFEVFKDSLPGIYFSPFLSASTGKVYKLEILAEGKYIFGVTSIPQPIAIDSIGFEIKAEEDQGITDTGAYMTVYFFDPPAYGNNYRAMFKIDSDSNIFAWGDLGDGDIVRDDEFINGRTWNLSYSRRFKPGDTINYFLNAIDRPAYNFWNSYFALSSNTGNPFATPVKLKSTVQGGIGSFTGMGVSFRQVVVPHQ